MVDVFLAFSWKRAICPGDVKDGDAPVQTDKQGGDFE
jgi:hypothetical protein